MEDKVVKLEKELALIKKLYQGVSDELRSANRLLDEYREKYDILLDMISPKDEYFNEVVKE